MPIWWHEITFDALCLFNSVTAIIALLGVVDLRQKLNTLIGK